MILCPTFCLSLSFGEEQMEDILTEELTAKQDYLSGDVQELVELQTQEKVIKKLEEVETNMVQATLKLLDGNTNGETIAIQTEIIEKAYEAAQEKQNSQSSQSDTDKALMDMLRKMLGKDEKQKTSLDNEGENSGKSGGQGQEGDGNPDQVNPSDKKFSLPTGSRRSVPSVAPTSGQLLPAEFQKLIDDYNEN